jgi:hypothetical protein
MARRNQIIYVPEVLRRALDHYTKLRGIRLAALLHELTPFVELAADNAAAKAGTVPPEPELPPMVKAAEVGEAGS